jgi:hypothetical protein
MIVTSFGKVQGVFVGVLPCLFKLPCDDYFLRIYC